MSITAAFLTGALTGALTGGLAAGGVVGLADPAGAAGMSAAADAGPSGITVSAAMMPAAASGLYSEDGARTALPRGVRDLVIEVQWTGVAFSAPIHQKL
jgi:hypothetical protein